MATSTSVIRAAIDAGAAQARADLEDLARIPGIAFDGFDPARVRDSAEATAALLERSGLNGVRLLTDGGAAPAVYGERTDAGPDMPTVLLYAHHDVQPTGDPTAWTSPPFEPTERDGRLYGRGCADDKAGVIAHASAVAAWIETADVPPVNVKVFIEGEEEVGSPNLEGFLAATGELLQSDVAVIADLVNWQVGVPSLTYVLRGMVDVHVSVDVLDHAVHSGMYGGPVPDPLTVLAKLLAGLTDDRGVVTLPQLRDGLRGPTADERAALQNLDFDAERFRAEAGLLEGIPFGGDEEIPVLQRVWMEPFLSVLGIDAPSVRDASNAIQPSASAKLGMRLGPGQDAARVRDALVDHLNAQAPQGVRVTARAGAAGDPYQADLTTPAAQTMIAALHEGYGTQPVLMGCGGSIPLVGPLQAANPDATMLLVGVEDPDSRAHGIDESLHLGDWESARASIAVLLGRLAAA